MTLRRKPALKVAIANFARPLDAARDFEAEWASFRLPPRPRRRSLHELPFGWGFHIFSLGVHLLDRGIAREVEFWDFSERRVASYTEGGVLWLTFLNETDLVAYLERHGYPDLLVNHGPHGQGVLQRLEGRCFRVHVPALRLGRDRTGNVGADCYLVDSEEYLDERSMLYVPVVNTWRLLPGDHEKQRDLLYLAACYEGKRHDIVVDALRGTDLSCHFHPVEPSQVDLSGTRIETSTWGERDLVELLQTSRIAVYPADRTSNPAAMWECVAADLPIVVNRAILGGKHAVVPGVTGELASEMEFGEVVRHVLARREAYTPRRHLDEHWDTVGTLDGYLAFFARMGWDGM